MIILNVVLSILTLTVSVRCFESLIHDNYFQCIKNGTFSQDDLIHKYSGIRVNYRIMCFLKQKVEITDLKISEVESLRYIRGKYRGECRKIGNIESELALFDKLDSKLNFPIGYNRIPDMLRGRVLSCALDLDESQIINHPNLLILNETRNTIDYFCGLTLFELRANGMTSELDDIDNLNPEIIDFENQQLYPTRSQYLKFEVSDRYLNSRDLTVGTSLNYALLSVFLPKKVVAMILSICTLAGMFMIVSRTLIETVKLSALGISILNFIETDIALKGKTLLEIDKRLSETNKMKLESRKQYLVQMKLILENSLLMNELLLEIADKVEEIVEKLEEINNQLRDIVKELEQINEQLSDINGKLGGIEDQISKQGDGRHHNECPDTKSDDRDFGDSIISSVTQDIRKKIEDLKCDDFGVIKGLVDDICLRYVVTKNELERIDNSMFLKLKYDSTNFLNEENITESCLSLGLNHPKFSSEYYNFNNSLFRTVSKDGNFDKSRYLNILSDVHMLLFVDLNRGYNLTWYYKAFSVVKKNVGLTDSSLIGYNLIKLNNELRYYDSICL